MIGRNAISRQLRGQPLTLDTQQRVAPGSGAHDVQESPQIKNAQLSVPAPSTIEPSRRLCLSWNHIYKELHTRKIRPAQIASMLKLQTRVIIQSRWG